MTSRPALAIFFVIAATLAACTSSVPPPQAPEAPPAQPAAAAPSAYGVSIATAVEVCKPPGERKYLDRLRCPDGTAPTYSRRGSGGSRTAIQGDAAEKASMDQMFREGPLAPGEPDYHIIDYYEVRCGDRLTEVVMDMYHCYQKEPTQAPPGFTIEPLP